MTGVADRLEERGYIGRRPQVDDRRVVVLELTKAGRKLFRQELDFYRSLVDQTLAPLAVAERGRILGALETLELLNDEALAG